jgi:predicted ribosome quality control (RQC) complex YloA/Tae2 family protein
MGRVPKRAIVNVGAPSLSNDRESIAAEYYTVSHTIEAIENKIEEIEQTIESYRTAQQEYKEKLDQLIGQSTILTRLLAGMQEKQEPPVRKEKETFVKLPKDEKIKKIVNHLATIKKGK